MKISAWGATDVGQTRKVNEDTFLLVPELGLAAVADGMGGFARGDVASQLACNVLRESVTAHRSVLELFRRSPTDATRGAVRAMLETAIQHACEEVHQAAVAITGEGGRMGTTMDALLIIEGTAFLAHVGDGRVFLLRGLEAHQLTEDHSLVQEQLRDGTLSPEGARKARNRNVITRALGVFPSVNVDTLHFELELGDRMLLCSDGLHRYVGLREVALTLSGTVEGATATELVQTANGRGGRDNITALVLRVDEKLGAEALSSNRAHLNMLRRVDLFQYCTSRELTHICQIASERRPLAGSVLFREGEAGRECFFVASGSVAIDKAEVRLATMRSGDYFGEMSLIDMPQRSADAVVLEDSVVLVIHRDRLLQLLKEDSDLGVKLMWQLLQKLSRVVRSSNEKLVAETVPFEPLDGDSVDSVD